MNNIECPYCHKQNYTVGPSMCTSMYFQPHIVNGKNINKDMNVTTTEAHCCECHYDFRIKEQGDKIWTEEGEYNPPKPPLDVDITASAWSNWTPADYVPDEYATRVSIAYIDKDGHPLREKTKVEKDIELINEKLGRLTKMVESLWEWNTHEHIERID